MVNFKIIVYTSRELLKYIEPLIGRKFFVNDYYQSLGVDFYRLRKEKRIGRGKYVELNYYFWILNPEMNFDHIRKEYETGADAAIVLLDTESEEFLHQLRKVLEEIYKVNRRHLPIGFIFKVKHELLDELDEEKVLQLVKTEADLLTNLGALVGFYFFSKKSKKPIKDALKSLLGFLSQKKVLIK